MSSTIPSATNGRPAKERPLSPHLSVYALIPNMVASIMHRITGIALYSGTLLVAWWLIAAASGPGYFAFVNGFFGSWFGMLILLGYTWALMHHMLGGLRHFAWDTGRLMSKTMATTLSYATFIGSGTATALIWIIGILVR